MIFENPRKSGLTSRPVIIMYRFVGTLMKLFNNNNNYDTICQYAIIKIVDLRNVVRTCKKIKGRIYYLKMYKRFKITVVSESNIKLDLKTSKSLCKISTDAKLFIMSFLPTYFSEN